MKVEQDPNLSLGRSRRPRATRNVTNAGAPRVGVRQGAATRSGRRRPIGLTRSILLEAQARDRIHGPHADPVCAHDGFAVRVHAGGGHRHGQRPRGTPKTGIQVQLCGDAHLLNFGAYASPERALLFDLNDFDETLPGPWEWDVKRLAASFVVASRENGFDDGDCRDAALSASVASYRQRMAEFSEMGELEVWYSRVGEEDIRGLLSDAKTRKRTAKKT